MAVQERLRGSFWGILATPFRESDLAVDHESLRNQVNLFSNLGASGVVALGVFGEGSALDTNEQRAVIETVCSSAKGLPVVVGISARTTAVAIEQARSAVAAAGDQLASLMVQANSPSSAVLATHFQKIYDATSAPIVLQDYPVASGVKVSVTEIVKTLALCPYVSAVKAENPPTGQMIAELAANCDIPIFGGLGGVGLIDELAAGAAGAMTGFSWPEGLLEAIRAWESAGMAECAKAWSKWLPLANFEAQPGIGLALRKEMFRLRGVFNSGVVRPPALAMPEVLRNIMLGHVEALGLSLINER